MDETVTYEEAKESAEKLLDYLEDEANYVDNIDDLLSKKNVITLYLALKEWL